MSFLAIPPALPQMYGAFMWLRLCLQEGGDCALNISLHTLIPQVSSAPPSNHNSDIVSARSLSDRSTFALLTQLYEGYYRVVIPVSQYPRGKRLCALQCQAVWDPVSNK